MFESFFKSFSQNVIVTAVGSALKPVNFGQIEVTNKNTVFFCTIKYLEQKVSVLQIVGWWSINQKNVINPFFSRKGKTTELVEIIGFVEC